MIPAGHTAVMAQRREAPDSLDLFCTPPWATRALVESVLRPRLLCRRWESAWDPACGLGHISAVLEEYFAPVVATDVFEHGGVRAPWPAAWRRVQDFLDTQAETPIADWVVTNPPFKVADAFVLRALEIAQVGVAMLVRTAWIEGADRYHRIFNAHPPTLVAQFVERVPMVKGRWDPTASTATAYAWVIWTVRRASNGHDPRARQTDLIWIPPGQREALTRPDDAVRLGFQTKAPLLASME